MFKKIAYFYCHVTDMDRAVDFYQNKLGLELLFQREDWSEFMIGGNRLALHAIQEMPATPSHGGAGLSLEVDGIEDVITTLKERGVKFHEELQVFPYGKLASFLDPDGNVIGLYEPPKKNKL